MLLLCLFSGALSATNITVRTSHNPVTLDDSFHLVFEADSNVDGDPDFTPLEKDFDILNSSQSTNMRLINGVYSLKKSWDLVLIAKDIGKFTIPSIAFGRDKSPSIRITVRNSVTPNSTLPGGQATIPAKIFLEAEVDKPRYRIQEQILLTLRLLRTVSITGATLSEPATSDPDAIIKRLGNDSNYETTRNGIRYHVVERRYVIYPQHSGKLTIDPVTFEGRVNATQPRTIFDQFRITGQIKRLRSKAIHLTIQPRPDGVDADDWLPASRLVLLDEWSDDIASLKTGEPVTRTITLVAEGQTGVLLPDLQLADIDGIKQYPNQPVTTDKETATGITGAKQIKIAMIPEHPGDYVLPAIHLKWWNTRSGKMETATLAEQHLTAHGNATTPAPAASITPDVSSTPEKAGSQPASPPDTPVTETPDATGWKWLSLILALGWLGTLLYFLVSRHPKQPGATASPFHAKSTDPATLHKLEKAVIQACKQNRPEKIKTALIAWATHRWPAQAVNSLSLIAPHCPQPLQAEINRLNDWIYAPDKKETPYQPDGLLDQFRSFCHQKTSPVAEKQLEPLYRIH